MAPKAQEQRTEYKPIDGYVWCDKLGEIHDDDELDPYQYGPPDKGEEDERCKPEDHRPVFEKVAHVITESVTGYYFYHWSTAGQETRALCGAQTMPTMMGPKLWGYRGHLGEKYCKKCAKEVGL